MMERDVVMEARVVVLPLQDTAAKQNRSVAYTVELG
jgi:hypothetical protein